MHDSIHFQDDERGFNSLRSVALYGSEGPLEHYRPCRKFELVDLDRAPCAQGVAYK